MATAFSIVCLIIEFIVFLFVLFSIGWDVLKLKGSVYDAFGCPVAAVLLNSTAIDKDGKCDRVCYGMWGVKKCGAHKPNRDMPEWGYPTKKVKQLANCAGAFDIVSAAVVLVAFILNILLACHCVSAWAVVFLFVFAIITIIISIGCLLGIYYYNVAPSLGPVLATLTPAFAGRTDIKIKELFHLYSAAGLIVCGWCLQVINLILMIINACCCSSSKSKSPSSSSSSSKKGSDEEKKSDHAPDHEDEEL